MSAGGTRTLAALALQLAALAALSLSLLGFSWLDTRSKPRVLLLVDRSESVPRAASDKAVADVMHAANAAGGGDLLLLEFAGRPAAPSTKAADSVASLEPSATNIEAALDAALAADARTPFASVIVISDGLENAGDLERALRAARDARLPVQWIAVGRPLPETRISEVLAPDRAVAGQRIQIAVQLAGRLDRPLRVKATTRAASGETQAANGEVDGSGRATDRARAQAATAPFSWTWRWRIRFRDKRSGRCRTPPSSTSSHGRRFCMRRVPPVRLRAACAKAAGC